MDSNKRSILYAHNNYLGYPRGIYCVDNSFIWIWITAKTQATVRMRAQEGCVHCALSFSARTNPIMQCEAIFERTALQCSARQFADALH